MGQTNLCSCDKPLQLLVIIWTYKVMGVGHTLEMREGYWGAPKGLKGICVVLFCLSRRFFMVKNVNSPIQLLGFFEMKLGLSVGCSVCHNFKFHFQCSNWSTYLLNLFYEAFGKNMKVTQEALKAVISSGRRSEVRIYKRKEESKKTRKKTDPDHTFLFSRPISFFLFYLVAFLVNFFFSLFLIFLFSFINSHLWLLMKSS